MSCGQPCIVRDGAEADFYIAETLRLDQPAKQVVPGGQRMHVVALASKGGPSAGPTSSWQQSHTG